MELNLYFQDLRVTCRITCLYHNCPVGITAAYAIYANIPKSIRPRLRANAPVRDSRSYFAKLEHYEKPTLESIRGRIVFIVDLDLHQSDLVWITTHATQVVIAKRIATRVQILSIYGSMEAIDSLSATLWKWINPTADLPVVLNAVRTRLSNPDVLADLKSCQALDSLMAFAEYDQAL
jgi:hypothetical protein